LIADFGYVGILLIVGVLFVVTTLLLPVTFRMFNIVPKKPSPAKESTYECGMETIGTTWVQFNFRYYFFAVMFVALDVLTVFLYPWAVNLKSLGLYGFVAVVIFFGILMVGYVYAWYKGALEWK
jgi:NADH-quinone oxidoreductase subunit A